MMKYSEVKERLDTIDSYIQASYGYVMAEEDNDEIPACKLEHIKFYLIEAVNEIANFTNTINRDNTAGE